MSARWLITDAEDDKLQGLSCEAQVIYMRLFRRYADFDTGVVSITLGQVKRTVEFIPDWGSKEQPRRVADVSNHYARARIAELERAGLIEKLPKVERFDKPKYRCLYASTALIRPEKEPQRNRKERTASENTVEIRPSSTVNRKGTAREEPQYSRYQDIPTTTTARARVNVPDDSISTETPSRGVPANWQPSEYAMEQLKDRFGNEEITALLPEFRIYWNSKATCPDLQALDLKFIQHAERTIPKQRKRNEANAKPRDNTHEQNHAHHRTPTPKKQSIRSIHERDQAEAKRLLEESYAKLQRFAEGGNG